MSMDLFLRGLAEDAAQRLARLEPTVYGVRFLSGRVEVDGIGVIARIELDDRPMVTGSGGAGPALAWVAGQLIQAGVCRYAWDPQEGAALEDIPTDPRIERWFDAVRRQLSGPELPTPELPDAQAQARGFLALLLDRGLVEVEGSEGLVGALQQVLALHPAERLAALDAVLMQHPDVVEVYASDEDLTMALADWG